MVPSVVFALILAQSSSVKGVLTVDGKAYPVVHLCAYEQEDPFDEAKTRIQVAMSPQAWTGACRDLNGGAAAGGIPVLTAVIEGAAGDWNFGTLYAKGQAYAYSFSGTEVPTKLERSGGAGFAGRMYTTKPMALSDWPVTTLDVTFSVPLQKLVPKSAPITGEAARNHPAAAVARKFLQAMSEGNMAAMRAVLLEAERPRMDEMLKSEQQKEILASMKEMASETLKIPVTSVTMRGELAEVVMAKAEADGSGKQSSKFVLRQEKGEWRITR